MAFKRILLRRDTSSNWTSGNAVLASGEVGYETNTGKFKIGNGATAWNALGYSIASNISAAVLNDLGDVTITSAANGDFLRWNGTAWINDAVNLSTDTVGSYVESLVAGTGITLSNNSGEAATPTVTVNTAVIAPIASPTFTGTVSGITKTMVGLGDVDNTTDANKPVSTATQTALDLKAPLASPTFTGTVSGITSTMVGLGNVNNTTDANKPVSTATQTALDLKSNLASPTFSGTVTTNDLTVGGNLTVSGTTTSVNTETVTVNDNIIVLNNNATGAPSENAGVEIERGSETNVVLRWNETNDKWELTNDGTNYSNIATDATVATATTLTLDNLSDVTITSAASGDFVKWNGSAWVNDPINLATDTVGNYMTDVSAGTGITVTHTPGEGSTATIAVGASVVQTTDTGTVTSAMIADGTIANGDINASAAIALSKLASGTSAQIIVADGSGVPAYVTMSGQGTISNAGVLAIVPDDDQLILASQIF